MTTRADDTADDDTPEDHRSRRWPWAALVVVVLGGAAIAALVLLSGEDDSPPAPKAPAAAFAAVRPAGATVAIETEGFVRARAEVELVSEVEGRIVEIVEGFESGARFPAGTQLVTLDQERYRVEVADARAALDRARSELAHARNQVERIESLAARELGSETRLEEARVKRERAEAAVEQAQAALEQARLRLDDTTIRAPFAAAVIEESAAIGRYVRPGEAIARVFAVDHAEVEVGLSPRQARVLMNRSASPGNPAAEPPVGLPARVRSARLTEGSAFAGVVDRVKPSIDPAARTLDLVVRVEAAFDATGARPPLRLDELAGVTVEVPAADAWWRVPPAALEGDERLWRLGPQDRLQPVDVRLVLRQENTAIVASEALRAGDRVLVTDLTSPAPGLEVRPTGADPLSTPPRPAAAADASVAGGDIRSSGAGPAADPSNGGDDKAASASGDERAAGPTSASP